MNSLQLKGVQLSCVLVTVTSLMGGLLADSLKFQIDIKKNGKRRPLYAMGISHVIPPEWRNSCFDLLPWASPMPVPNLEIGSGAVFNEAGLGQGSIMSACFPLMPPLLS